jgi:hypothetical protein
MCFRCSWPFPRFFSSRGPEPRLVPVCWERVMFLHTNCTVPAEPGFEETVVLDGHWWAKTGGGWGLASTGKSCFSLFSCDSDFSMRSFLPFVLFQVFLAVCGPLKDQENMCLSVRGAGRPFLRPCWESYFSVNGPNNGLGTQGCSSQVASYLSLHVVQPPAVVYSHRDMTRSVMSLSDGFVDSDVR